MTLTAADVAATLDNPEHLGFGYARTRADGLPEATVTALDAAVAAVANELGLTAGQLFHWSNSKHGRWLTDAVWGRGEPATPATVREYLTARTVAQAQA
jgi:hypothetical protein